MKNKLILGTIAYMKLTERVRGGGWEYHVDWDAVRCYDELRAEVLDTRTIDGKPVNLDMGDNFRDEREREYCTQQKIFQLFGASWEAIRYKRMSESSPYFDKDIRLSYVPRGDSRRYQSLATWCRRHIVKILRKATPHATEDME